MIKEGDEEEKEDEEENINLINTNKQKLEHNDLYLLEKIDSLDDSKDNVENKTSQFSPDFLNLETQ